LLYKYGMSEISHSTPRRPRRVLLAVLALLLFSIFVALGSWQVWRLQWKEELIARVNQRVHQPAADLPPAALWPQVNAANDEYRHVAARGVWLNDKSARVQAVTELGAGYWLMTPLKLADGSVVLVNRGFIAPARKLPVATPEGEQSVTGLMRMSQAGGAFLRDNDPRADRWTSRDVAALAQSRGLDRVAPFFIDADATPGQSNPELGPVGGLTVVRFANNHLGYALTWFALAVMVAAAWFWILRHEHRR
jgi:surfeit locus 1 family protein